MLNTAVAELRSKMKAVILACVFAILTTVVTAAPALIQGQLPQDSPIPEQQQQLYRDKRSSYPPAFYAPAPCASAGIPAYASLPAVAPAAAYQVNLAPALHHSAAITPNGFGYGIPQYRDADEQHEMMQVSDMDHMMSEHIPMARYGYGTPVASPYAVAPASIASGAALSGVAGQLLTPAAAAAPSIGVFPAGSTGGCSVPLLLSCSPTIVSGRIVQTHTQQPYGASAAAATSAHNGYRGVDEHREAHELQSTLEHPVAHEQLPHAAHESLNIHQ